MASDSRERTFPIFGGVHSEVTPADIAQGPGDEDWKGVLSLAQADNAMQPTSRHDLQTRPGMADVRATAFTVGGTAGVITGGVHLGEIADRLVLTAAVAGQRHTIFEDDANPGTEKIAGTNFTNSPNNLITSLLFTDGAAAMAIFLAMSRDLPQSVNSAGTRADFTIAGTGLTSLKPYSGEIFGQRLVAINCDRDGTVEDDFYYWSDLRDGNRVSDYRLQRDSLQTSAKDKLRCIKKFGEVAIVHKLNNVYGLAVNPLASKPFNHRELPMGRYRGACGPLACVEADGYLWWMSWTNLHRMNVEGRVDDVGDRIKSLIAGLQDDRREYCVAGYDAVNNLVLFAVSNSGDTQHKRIIAVNTKTLAIFPNWTLSVNAMVQRMVSSDPRLILGGYSGKYRNFPSGTTGNLDDAASAIDCDIITPRHHLGAPTIVKLWEYLKVRFKKTASEAVTVQYRMDDESSWNSFAESPYTVTGTAGDVDLKLFPLMKAGVYGQFRFRDAISGDVLRIQEYSIGHRLLHRYGGV